MKDLLTELQSLVDAWLSQRKYANLSVLARVSGVSYPTLRRIVQGEMSPALQTVMQLAPVLLDQGPAQEFVARHFPEVAKLYRINEEKGYQVAPSSEAFQSLTRDEFIVFSLAEQENGIAKSRLIEKLGEGAIPAIERLTALDLIVEEPAGRIKTRIEKVFVPGTEGALHRMKLAIDSFDRTREQDYGSFYYLFTKGLNDDGILAAHRVFCEAERKLLAIYEDESFQGRKVMYHILLSSFLDAKGEE